MKSSVKVSVIMPTYNVEKYIGRCIESILQQQMQDFELIIIDDCSSDGTANVIKEYIKIDPRITYICHVENEGVSQARNTGINMAQGEYVCFVDPDDYCGDRYLQAMVDVADKERCELVISGYVKEKDGNIYNTLKTMEQSHMSSSDTLVEMLLKEHFDWCPCDKLFITRKLIENNIFFSREYKLAEDLDFCWRYLKKCNTAIFIPAYQYHYIQHSNSATHKKNTTIRMTSVSVMKKCYSESIIFGAKAKERMGELYIKEMASCIKDIIGYKVLYYDVISMQKEIRKNISYLWTNKDFALYIKLAIIFFCLPYEVCYYVYTGFQKFISCVHIERN